MKLEYLIEISKMGQLANGLYIRPNDEQNSKVIWYEVALYILPESKEFQIDMFVSDDLEEMYLQRIIDGQNVKWIEFFWERYMYSYDNIRIKI